MRWQYGSPAPQKELRQVPMRVAGQTTTPRQVLLAQQRTKQDRMGWCMSTHRDEVEEARYVVLLVTMCANALVMAPSQVGRY